MDFESAVMFTVVFLVCATASRFLIVEPLKEAILEIIVQWKTPYEYTVDYGTTFKDVVKADSASYVGLHRGQTG